MLWLFVGPTGVYLLDFFCSGIQFDLPRDRTRRNGYHLTRNAFTAWGMDKKRMQTDILLSVTGPLVLSGKV